MRSLNRSIRAIAVAGAALSFWMVTPIVAGVANAAAPNVTYTCSGTFATPPVSGNDLLKLAGEPFSIIIVANAATPPTSHGATWSKFTKLKMTGTVQSALLPTPTSISSNSASIQLAIGNPSYDVFGFFSPLLVVGLQLNITATIHMPVGTIAKALIHPFTAPVTLTPANATMVYSDVTASTTLGMNGTLNAVLGGAPTAQTPGTLSLYAAGSGGTDPSSPWVPDGPVAAIIGRYRLVG